MKGSFYDGTFEWKSVSDKNKSAAVKKVDETNKIFD